MKKLNFIVIGAQKSGTTALDYYLRQHPDIGMGNRKEVHFFDNEKYFLDSVVDYKKYHQSCDFNNKSDLYGEVTPIYIYWKSAASRIWEYNEDIKLIAILRNPIDRAFSHWNMESSEHKEKHTFFDCILNEGIKAKSSLPLQSRVFSYIDRGFYSKQIKIFQRYFDENQMMFIKFEAFRKNQEDWMNQIFNFLEIDKSKFKYQPKEIHNRKYSHKINNE
jgi:hypothetical protein